VFENWICIFKKINDFNTVYYHHIFKKMRTRGKNGFLFFW